MKKIVSRQIPNARIVRPLLVGGVLLGLAAGPAEAVDQKTIDRSTAIQTIISGDQGCVVGAKQQQQKQQPQPKQQTCRQNGCVVTCN